MIADSSHIEYVEKVLDTADSIGIESVIIEPDNVRGMSIDTEVFILHQTNVPTFPFGTIAINQIPMFKMRHGLVKTASPVYDITQHSVEIEKKPVQFVRSIKMSTKKTTVAFRCTSPVTIRAPREVLQQPIYTIHDIEDCLDIMVKGMSAMASPLITFNRVDGATSFEMADGNGDVLKYDISDTTQDADDSDFSFDYTAKVLLNILKKTKNNHIELNELGMIKTSINSLDVYIKPVA